MLNEQRTKGATRKYYVLFRGKQVNDASGNPVIVSGRSTYTAKIKLWENSDDFPIGTKDWVWFEELKGYISLEILPSNNIGPGRIPRGQWNLRSFRRSKSWK